jgi:Concanavalin A-like lectin/glucanases superfamily
MPASLGVRSLSYGSPVNDRAPLNRGLMAWWRVLPLRSGGSTWRDLLRGLAGQLVGMGASSQASGWGATTYPGGAGELRFDGTNDYGIMPGPAMTTGTYTIALWIKDFFVGSSFLMDTSYAGTRLVVSLVGGNWGGNPRALSLLVNGGPVGLGATDSIATNAWSHIAITLNTATSVSVGYVNGVATGTGSYSETFGAASGTFMLGTRDSASGNFFRGTLDDLRLSSRAFTAADVQHLYTASRQGYPQELNWQVWPPAWAVAVPTVPRRLWQGAIFQAVPRARYF